MSMPAYIQNKLDGSCRPERRVLAKLAFQKTASSVPPGSSCRCSLKNRVHLILNPPKAWSDETLKSFVRKVGPLVGINPGVIAAMVLEGAKSSIGSGSAIFAGFVTVSGRRPLEVEFTEVKYSHNASSRRPGRGPNRLFRKPYKYPIVHRFPVQPRSLVNLPIAIARSTTLSSVSWGTSHLCSG